MNYQSTRGNAPKVTASQAILKGIAPDGGLYIPESFPKLDPSEIINKTYEETAYAVLRDYLDFTEPELKKCISSAYQTGFDTPEIAPIKQYGDQYYLELFHGRTLAFKDMALSILPHFMTLSAKKNNLREQIVILTATSGDTGKAALSGFADVEGISILVFYPKDGVSDIQRKQMITQEGNNIGVIGIDGNFDQAQTGVKNIFNDIEFNEELRNKGYILSSANSINIGRLLPQIVYYYYAYAQLVATKSITLGEQVTFTVPTGNFGDILAGYYAKQMGLPIHTLFCASNDNKVLYDFFTTGTYDINRPFHLTSSPSMDILISSNLERYLYHQCNDPTKIATIMNDLRTKSAFDFDMTSTDIIGAYATETEVTAAIREVYAEQYILDTHTAVAYAAIQKTKKADGYKNIILSTASPYKFAEHVCKAIQPDYAAQDAFAWVDELHKCSNTPIPPQIATLRTQPERHTTTCGSDEMQETLLLFLNNGTLGVRF